MNPRLYKLSAICDEGRVSTCCSITQKAPSRLHVHACIVLSEGILRYLDACICNSTVVSGNGRLNKNKKFRRDSATTLPQNEHTPFARRLARHLRHFRLRFFYTLFVQRKTGMTIKNHAALPQEIRPSAIAIKCYTDFPKWLGHKALDTKVLVDHKTEGGKLARACRDYRH